MGRTLRRVAIALLVYAASVIVLSPFMVALYRLSVFRAVPYDDYAPYLLWLAGTGQGGVPDSPYAYRLLSMVAALPLYWALPAPGLTNLAAGVSPLWLRATLALNLLNYLAIVAAVLVTVDTARRRCGLERAEAWLAGGLLFALAWYTQLAGIDGLALLLIAGGIALVPHPAAFAGLLLASVGCNEKVALVLALWLLVRVALVADDRRRLALPCLASVGAVALYVGLVRGLHLPGNDYQTHPAGFLVTVRENLMAYASPRGIVLNLLPIAVLAGLAACGHRRGFGERPPPLFRAVDLLVIPALAGVALVLTHLFQAGRIVAHTAPIFVIPFAAALRDDRSPRRRQP